jgi:hypothetical protein
VLLLKAIVIQTIIVAITTYDLLLDALLEDIVENNSLWLLLTIIWLILLESVTIIELATTGNTCEYCASATYAFIYTYFT